MTTLSSMHWRPLTIRHLFSIRYHHFIQRALKCLDLRLSGYNCERLWVCLLRAYVEFYRTSQDTGVLLEVSLALLMAQLSSPMELSVYPVEQIEGCTGNTNITHMKYARYNSTVILSLSKWNNYVNLKNRVCIFKAKKKSHSWPNPLHHRLHCSVLQHPNVTWHPRTLRDSLQLSLGEVLGRDSSSFLWNGVTLHIISYPTIIQLARFDDLT